MQSNKLLIIIAPIIVIILVIFGILFLPKFLAKKSPQQIGCTMEAKICPDGSAIGRTGPNCEFAKCPQAAVLGSIVNFSIGQQIIFTDGLSVTLTQINDSRCKQGVVCIWAGELSPTFAVKYGNNASQSMQITLGMLTAKQVTKNGYTFELKGASETTASIIVTKSAQMAGNCFVGGCSSEICSDKPGIVSTCTYNSEYVCYKTAICARQANGQCGWTQTAELTKCLKNNIME